MWSKEKEREIPMEWGPGAGDWGEALKDSSQELWEVGAGIKPWRRSVWGNQGHFLQLYGPGTM